MTEVNYLAVGAAAVAAMAVSLGWYTVFGRQLAALSRAAVDDGQPPPWKLAVEFGRCVLVAAVVAGLAGGLSVPNWPAAAGLGLLLWIGFPVVLLAGSVLWESVPARLAALHAGDWLVKLVVVAVIVGAWR
jgi:Protein of unknown function (DUF1761)